MNSKSLNPHVVFVPANGQGHIRPALQLAKLLHHNGFYITFVITESSHRRMVNAPGPDSLQGLPDFRFDIIPDSTEPVSDPNVKHSFSPISESLRNNLMQPFIDLLYKLNYTNSLVHHNIPPVTCIIADAFMNFTIEAAEIVGVPIISFFIIAACGVMGCKQLRALKDKGLISFQGDGCFTKNQLDTILDWIPGMKDIRLGDLPIRYLRDRKMVDMIEYITESVESASRASAIIIHTFDELEKDVLKALSSIYPRIYAIGPLPPLLDRTLDNNTYSSLGLNFWKEENECMKWLNTKENGSVIYVSFGSMAELKQEQLVEFALGIANSKHNFLWAIRPDIVMGDKAILPPEFIEKTKERCMVSGWCPQEDVLKHPSVLGFLTHCGWNSTIESISYGVPMICWPVFADQHTNCRYSCNEWGIGLEMDSEVHRDGVEKLVREFMEGDKGKKIKHKVIEWKKKAEEAISVGGSSITRLNDLINEISSKTSVFLPKT